jgi:chromosome segregation protein
MQLKKIELIGFKSFADRTEFEFKSGVTCLVGPNGCGKSNVVDAIKWVLGEQSAKSLRGKEMTDVLFSGSDGKKSLGYCEATLTFSNNKGMLPLEYDEVAVSRRLYRSGEGEYLINNNPCRLKDIKHLFMDTGIGVDSYSLIEQGKVDVLLHANAQERRCIFEEAAGISKYKAQKKESLSKLERVETNLVRLGDIIEELERQLRSVKYQAAKARRYQQYITEIKELRISFSLFTYNRMHGEKEALCKERTQKDDRENALAAELGLIDSRESELRLKLSELEDALAGERERNAIRETNISNTEGRIEEIANLLRETDQDGARLAARLGELGGRLDEERKSRRRLEEEARRKEVAVEELAHKLESGQADLEERSSELNALNRDIDSRKALVIDLLQKETSLHNQIGSLSAEKKNLYRQLEKAQAALAASNGQMQQVLPRREELLNRSIACNNDVAQIDRALLDLAGHAHAIESDMKAIQEKMHAARAEVGSLEARLDVLKEMDRKYDDIRSLLSDGAESADGVTEVPAILADLIEVRPEHARAVDAALGEKAQAILTADLDGARRLARRLKEKNAAEALFVPMVRGDAATRGGVSRHPEVIARAAECVSCPAEYRGTLEALLSDTVVCNSLDDAVRALGELGGSVKIVTAEGDVVERNGAVVIKAAGAADASAGLLFRKSEERRLQAEIEGLEGALQALSAEFSEKTAEREKADEQKESLIRKRDETREALHAVEKELDLIKQQIDRLTDELDVSEVEKSENQSEIEAVEEKERALAARRTELEAEQTSTDAEIRELSARFEEVNGQKAALQESLSRIQTQRAIYEEQKRNLDLRIESAGEQLARLEKEIEDSKIESTQVEQKALRLREEDSEKRDMLNRLIHEKQSAADTLAKLEDERTGLTEGLEENARAAKEKKEAHHALEAELQELRLRENEISIKMGNLAERIMEDYKVDLAERHKDYREPEEPVDWSEIEKRINELRQKIDNMGNVNLEAINEQDSLETRLGFLTAQRDDLLKAKHSLEEAIRKINKTSRELFTTTFEAVRGHFQVIFRKLFNGGRADVFLEDETDVLESGVDIVARPPGKEPRSISLLSGGEKVLTATALLFAILKAKPSPFCVMDEVDAALDESNIDRFAAVLQEFLEDSQFILVTHNKRSMSMADIIYGITMQKSGVSKRVAIRFEDIAEKDGEIVLPEENKVAYHSEC